MNTYAVYFSPTGTSRTNAVTIAEEFGDDVSEIDLTVLGNEPAKTIFGKEDIVVFGAPVYGGRIYKGAVDRFLKLKGKDTPCIVTVTYGNRDYEDALIEMRDLVLSQEFVPFAAAALIGQHTYGEIQVGRPNSYDRTEHREFARRARKKLCDTGTEIIQVPGNQPYKDGGNGQPYRPHTTDQCVACGLCAANCPEGAIDNLDFSKIDDTKCIACFRCIKVCPVNAKNMDDKAYNKFAAEFSRKLVVRRENEYFI